MPSIKRTERGGVIRWDGKDWMAGLIPYFTSTVNLMGGDGFLYNLGVNPYNRPGYLIQGPLPVNVPNASLIDAVLKNGAGNGNMAYPIGGTKLHEISATTGAVSNTATFPHTITAHMGHNTVDGSDSVIYYAGGTKYLFYSWVDNTDGDIGRWDLSATFDDDFMTTVPSGASATGFQNTTLKTIPLIVGDDNILYAGNGRYVAAYNGNLGTPTINYQALDLPSDYIITSFAKLKNFLVIYAYKGATNSGGTFFKTETTAFFWDYTSDSFTYAFNLPGNYVNGGFIYKNTVGCFVFGENYGFTNSHQNKMLIFNGDKFDVIKTYPTNGSGITIPGHGGVEVFDDVIQWNANGYIYQYSSPINGVAEGSLNVLSKVSGGSSGGGMLKAFNVSIIFASAGTGTNGGLQSFFSTSGNAYPAEWRTPFIYPPFQKFSQARIQEVKIFWFGTAVAGHGFTLNINTNLSGAVTTIIDNTTTVSNLITSYFVDTNNNPLPVFSNLQLDAVYSSSGSNLQIAAIEVYYEDINQPK